VLTHDLHFITKYSSYNTRYTRMYVCMCVCTYIHLEASRWKVCSTNSAWNSFSLSTECSGYLVGFSKAVTYEVRYNQACGLLMQLLSYITAYRLLKHHRSNYPSGLIVFSVHFCLVHFSFSPSSRNSTSDVNRRPRLYKHYSAATNGVLQFDVIAIFPQTLSVDIP
jgi:hypothetical protein